ncbi:hypothetical protein [Aggregatilinea lenta]|uniref:hypothetical protein n=1 Tax=Aggregatilinea lenta TaxID=913108 RepID=UPI000E5B36AC|nr:hypothetical protein [Aggregatilinea lenta]
MIFIIQLEYDEENLAPHPDVVPWVDDSHRLCWAIRFDTIEQLAAFAKSVGKFELSHYNTPHPVITLNSRVEPDPTVAYRTTTK